MPSEGSRRRLPGTTRVLEEVQRTNNTKDYKAVFDLSSSEMLGGRLKVKESHYPKQPQKSRDSAP